MGMTTAAANALLEHILNNADWANIGDAAGLQNSVAAGNFYLSLHTADPGAAGTQLTNEIAYTSYARLAIVRSGAAWTVTANAASPAAIQAFATGTGGAGTAAYFGIGTDSGGAGNLLLRGTVTPNIVCGDGITPRLTTATTITVSTT